MQRLSLPDFPLHGQALIEASAGTGKTYTITGLYNRLLLGHGRSQEYWQRLRCDQILVVTFTRAATEELRGRIRQRLRDTLEDLLRLEHQSDASSEVQKYLSDLAQVLNQPIEPLRSQLLPWLQTNLALMDEASIFTIHGFCQRMLKQFAFDSGVVFDAELVVDADEYLRRACEDVWRQQLYGLSLNPAQTVLKDFPSPHALLARVRQRLSHPDVQLLPQDIATQSFTTVWQQLAEVYAQLQSLWQVDSSNEIAQLIQNSGLNKNSYSRGNVPKWLMQVDHYCNQDSPLPLPKDLVRFSNAAMQEKLKSGELPQHAFFQQVDELLLHQERLRTQLNYAWLDQVRTRYFELLQQAAVLTPDDLLRLLRHALEGEQGEALAAQIRRLYPVALIDEFQDTDAQQCAIFNRIYPKQDDSTVNDPALIMIGDPKQAIYGFRGADIFTYIQQRRQLSATQRFTLNTNYRSHSRLVAGVNRIFAEHAAPFLYDQDIEFLPVQASGQRDNAPLRVHGALQTPLQCWYDGQSYTRQRAQIECAQQCARSIATLLSDAACLGDKPVEAKDIAVLVRSRKQASLVRDKLSQLGIGSVFLTRDSVFDAREAKDTLVFLQAVAHPTDEHKLRALLATATHGYRADYIHQLLHNEALWEQELLKTQHYHELWQRRGVMALIMQWLENDDRAVYLRQLPEGERRLTNLLHLGELLQNMSRRVRGHEALLRWLGEQVFGTDARGDEAQLRLESDANLVSIVTIHKSKGLQYPVVMLPFLWDDSAQLRAQSDVLYFDERLGPVLALNPDAQARDQANKDALAEAVRLLYVALTRAEQACFVWLMDGVNQKTGHSALTQSALGYLLFGQAKSAAVDWDSLYQRSDQHWFIGDYPNWSIGQPRKAPFNATQLAARVMNERVWDAWRVSSYSQLAQGHGDQTGLSLPDERLLPDEASLSPEPELLQEIDECFDATHIAFTFERGAEAGTCLHAILERWDFNDTQVLKSIVQEELARYGLLSDDPDSRIKALCQWLIDVVQSPIYPAQGEAFSLSDVAQAQRLDEMEFYLPMKGLTDAQISQLCDGIEHSPRFSFSPLQGYLKGFIDLIICHQGRYYVLDYKSNFLGTRVQDYQPQALQQAMYEHKYDLQAWLYTLALDQLLRQRLPDYQPEQHLGGVVYCFLRGMHLGRNAPRMAEHSAGQGDLFAESGQVPGLYYQTISTAKLAHWRQTVLGVEDEA